MFNEKTSEIIKMCRCCFMCRHACPVFLATKLDSHTPRGYAINLSRINEGLADWDEEGLERLFHCTQCGLCRGLCAFHWAEDEMVLAGRREMVRAQREPERVKQAAGKMARKKRNNLFEASRYEKQNWDVLYIAGSALRNGHDSIIRSAAKLLSAAGVGWTMLRSEDTSGAALYELGYEKEYDAWLEEIKNRITVLNPKRVITPCAHTLSLLRKASIEVLHVAEFIQSLILDDTLKISPVKQHVMYHDPCHLGREFSVYDAPREIIRKCSDADVIEFYHSENEAECCGAGAAVDEVYPEIALRVAENRMKQAEENGADVVVTACPNCVQLLGRACASIQVLDLAEYTAGRLV